MQIWNAGLEYLHGCNVGLDGVAAQQENYKKSGFKLAYRNIRYEGVTSNSKPLDDNTINLAELPFDSISSYDRPFYPAGRLRFIKAWINQPDSHALGILRNERLAAYGVIRQCSNGYKIGPLYADNSELAESLFQSLSSKVKPGQSIYLDVPEVNQDAVALAERFNMKKSFETARMYTGEKPTLPIGRVFGVLSFEIG